jgi:hypothetical protein
MSTDIYGDSHIGAAVVDSAIISGFFLSLIFRPFGTDKEMLEKLSFNSCPDVPDI